MPVITFLSGHVCYVGHYIAILSCLLHGSLHCHIGMFVMWVTALLFGHVCYVGCRIVIYDFYKCVISMQKSEGRHLMYAHRLMAA